MLCYMVICKAPLKEGYSEAEIWPLGVQVEQKS